MSKDIIESINKDYPYGFITQIEEERLRNGIDEDIIKKISKIKQEPDFLLKWRLQAFEKWQNMKEPSWSDVKYPEINFQEICYYSQPKASEKIKSLDDVDPEILYAYKKLGIPLHEQNMLQNVAIDAVFDSVSVATTFKEKLKNAGVIFCSMRDAIYEYPELIEQYLGSVVKYDDNFYACLNSAVFSDGSFVYIPKETRCPMELSTYFRINARNTGQFERTLIIADSGSFVSYLEGCTAPMRDENQLHAAVVELVAMDNAEIKYSTIQNWYPGDKDGKGGIYNFVTKRGHCLGKKSKISWTQVETGSAITWKYPSVVLSGDDSSGIFNSIAITKNHQQADTGSKMIHIGKRTKSIICSKGISANQGLNTYRGLVKILASAENAQNFTECDSLILSKNAKANTHPTIDCRRSDAKIEHEARTSKIADDQLLYCSMRGLDEQESTYLIVGGFCKEVFQKLPLEFAAEAQQLLELTLEGSIG